MHYNYMRDLILSLYRMMKTMQPYLEETRGLRAETVFYSFYINLT